MAAPLATPLDALFWDTADPYHYVRSARWDDANYLLVGGEDHKTGQDPLGGAQGPFYRLLDYARRLGAEPVLQWSAQVVESVDGLPYIGRSTEAERVHVATGFGGNGTTFGTSERSWECPCHSLRRRRHCLGRPRQQTLGEARDPR